MTTVTYETVNQAPAPDGQARELLNTTEAARYLGSQLRLVSAATRRGMLPWAKGARRSRLYARSDLDAAREDVAICRLLHIAPTGAVRTREAMRILGVSIRSVVDFAEQGLLTIVRVGRYRYFWQRELEELKAKRESRVRPTELQHHLSVAETAKRLGVKPNTVYSYRRQGVLHPVRWGRETYFDPQEVTALCVSGWHEMRPWRSAETFRKRVNAAAPAGTISTRQAAERLGILITSTLLLVYRGRLRTQVLGGRHYFFEQEVEEYAKRRRSGRAGRSNARKPPRRSKWIAMETTLEMLKVSQMALTLHEEAGEVRFRVLKDERWLYLRTDVEALAIERGSGQKHYETQRGRLSETDALSLLEIPDYLLASFRRSDVLSFWEEDGERWYWCAEVEKLQELRA